MMPILVSVMVVTALLLGVTRLSASEPASRVALGTEPNPATTTQADSTSTTTLAPTTSLTPTTAKPTHATVVSTNAPATKNMGFSPSGGRPFAVTSPFNTPIPANIALDPQNAGIVANLQSGNHVVSVMNGIPAWHADASTPNVVVRCTEPWGECPTNVPVPLPPEAEPSDQSDYPMVVIDWSTRTAYEYWQFHRNTMTTSWSKSQSIDGDGRQGGAVGAGVSRLAGLISVNDMRQGYIDHALVFSTDFACEKTWRFPATKTDGSNMRGLSPCIEEGARIQLDPSIDIDALPGLSKGDRMVGKALQTYGAYNIDNGGARMGFGSEMPTTPEEQALFKNAGLMSSEWLALKLPWNKLRVTAR